MSACYESLDLDGCNRLLGLLAGLRVSRVWQGAEPTVILAFGRLHRERFPRFTHVCGQVDLMVESDWRVEKPRSIHIGSSFSQRTLERLLPGLVGLRVTRLFVEAGPRELCAEFSDGRVFRTFGDWAPQPMWTVLVKDKSLIPLDPLWKGVDVTPCIHVERGRPQIQYAFDPSGADVKALKRRYRCPPGAV